MSCVLDDAYVATDDERIEAAVKAFGGKVVMTSVHHKSGTDRCYEACTKIGGDFDVVVNIQGDEPFIQPSQLDAVKACFEDVTTQIATLVKPFTADEPFAVLENVNSPKVVVNTNWNALYFSRSIIPYQRNAEKQDRGCYLLQPLSLRHPAIRMLRLPLCWLLYGWLRTMLRRLTVLAHAFISLP